jgi:hypothetical protein
MLPNPIADVDSEIGDNSIDLNPFVKFVPRKKPNHKHQISNKF